MKHSSLRPTSNFAVSPAGRADANRISSHSAPGVPIDRPNPGKGKFVRALLSSTAAIVLALATPLAAHADTTLTFTPDGGSPYTYDVTAPPTFSHDDGTNQNFEFIGTATDGDLVYFTFYGPEQDAYYASLGAGIGHVDLYAINNANSQYLILDGVTLYTGPVGTPTLLPGTYNLTADPVLGRIGGTLVIGTTGVTPEPSSLVLLGTGALSLVGAARRKLCKA